ncbi:MAG: NADH-quinone oxidoreductase subunit NuoK [Akkermansiaceae bacterium]|nr:NADH-quinone oxidoreductase subunit NuoK [Akkermansiaceae bacterium]MCP5542529.1 NADH-quinone oxidoreductase subunit NuoK [Akkermansiaceae bacterium]MCP5547931.1 NADH-quinone oxidoreductase subunit NuoK [Akkermansiaceae bacterium]
MTNPLTILVAASSVLFALGLLAVLTRRNAILILVGVELMLNAANINFIAFWWWNKSDPSHLGPMFVLFAIAIAAAEAAVGLAIILMVFRHTRSTDLNRLNSLRG